MHLASLLNAHLDNQSRLAFWLIGRMRSKGGHDKSWEAHDQHTQNPLCKGLVGVK